jgi:hypothetical protein
VTWRDATREDFEEIYQGITTLWTYLTTEKNKRMRIARGTQRTQKSLKDKFKKIKDKLIFE